MVYVAILFPIHKFQRGLLYAGSFSMVGIVDYPVWYTSRFAIFETNHAKSKTLVQKSTFFFK